MTNAHRLINNAKQGTKDKWNSVRQRMHNSKGQWITHSLIGVHHYYCNNTNMDTGGKKNKCINGIKIARRQTRGTTIGKPSC